MTRYTQNPVQAICDLVNFVLKSTGCDSQVELHDIEDPDHATTKLTDIQDAFQALKVTEYPLISKAKSNHLSFRSTMTAFFESIILAAHAAGLLYTDETLMENLLVWVTSLSSSAIRPFRHTATAIALAIASTMCGLTADVTESLARTMKQKEGEQKKKKVNKERVEGLQTKIVAEQKRHKILENILEDIFSTVYVHRYRDVEPKIRVDCVTALGTWITTAPEVFFSGQYIRYLGWMLADIHAPTRAEVIKQLSKLFRNKDNVGRLRAFTERFQPRMVEMASRDAEASVRTAAVELLDMVRETGLLEPDNIDTIGRLLFDKEARVRKAVGGFFAENVNDLYESVVEDLGGEEGIEEYLGEEAEDDYDSPRIDWLKFICLAEVLESYAADSQEESAGAVGVGALNVNVAESRVALAAKAIYENVPEVKDWEVLAGYLVFDHSSLPTDETDPERAFRVRCQPSEGQEILLLEILNVAVQSRLVEAVKAETDKKGKRTKARTEASSEIQVKTAIHLANLIPQLLKKFGSNPATATAVLRLEHVLNLEIFQELRQDSTTYSSLLDDINRQFLTHADQRVLAEASNALLHARSFEDLGEITERKVQELWEDTINTLRMLVDSDLDGNLTDLCNTVRRIANLAVVSDCVDIFNEEQLSSSKQRNNTASPYNILLDLINKYLPHAETDLEVAEQVNELMLGAMKALLFHNMWASLSLRNALQAETTLPDLPSYDTFAQTLQSVMDFRKGVDSVRLAAATTYLDLYTLFGSFRYLDTANINDDVKELCQPIPQEGQTLLLSIFTAIEKYFAKKTRRVIEPSPDDASVATDSEPEDSDSDDDDDDDDDENDDGDDDADDDDAKNKPISKKTIRILEEKVLAEQHLCELTGKIVIAIRSDLLSSDAGKRLERNKTHLGNNYKEVIAHLAKPTTPKKKKGPKTALSGGGGKGKMKRSEDLVEAEDDEEDEEEDEERVVEEGGEEDLQRRELLNLDEEDDSGDEDEWPRLELDLGDEDLMGD